MSTHNSVDDTDVVYFRNEEGGVQSCSQAHWDLYCTETSRGGRIVPAYGYILLTVEEAKAAEPRLFGKLDPDVEKSMTHEERLKRFERSKLEADILKFEASQKGR